MKEKWTLNTFCLQVRRSGRSICRSRVLTHCIGYETGQTTATAVAAQQSGAPLGMGLASSAVGGLPDCNGTDLFVQPCHSPECLGRCLVADTRTVVLLFPSFSRLGEGSKSGVGCGCLSLANTQWQNKRLPRRKRSRTYVRGASHQLQPARRSRAQPIQSNPPAPAKNQKHAPTYQHTALAPLPPPPRARTVAAAEACASGPRCGREPCVCGAAARRTRGPCA